MTKKYELKNTYKLIHTFLNTHHPFLTITIFTKNIYNKGGVCKDQSFDKQMPVSANKKRTVKNRMA